MERIAAIEKSVLPTLVIKGETPPTVTLAERTTSSGQVAGASGFRL